MCFCVKKSSWQRLKKSINCLSNHRFFIKPCDISKYDVVFGNYPTTARYLQHGYNLTIGVRIGLTDDHPLGLSNDNPAFSISKKEGKAQQLEKWVKTGIVLRPFHANHAKRNDITLHMLFGVVKLMVLQDLVLTFLMKQQIMYSRMCPNKTSCRNSTGIKRKCLVMGKRFTRRTLQCICKQKRYT